MDNRNSLLRHALRLFASRGYDAVGIQEIIDCADVTKPTLYHYFGSKRGLLKAVMQEHFDELHTAVAKAAEYRGDLTMSLRSTASAFFSYAGEHRDFYRMQLSMWFAPPESEANDEVEAFNTRIFQLLETLFARAAQDHGNMKGRQKMYAATWLGTINTYIGLSFNGYADLDDKLIQTTVQQFMHGIFS